MLSPTITWESFGATPHGLQEATLAGGSGGTWRLSPVTIELLVGVGHHVLAFTRRSVAPEGAGTGRLEVWTVRDGRADHYRGYPLEDGLSVLRATTGDGKLDVACRALLAFNRGDRAGLFAEQLGGRRLDDVRVLAETFEALVASALHLPGEAGDPQPAHLVIGFADDRMHRVDLHPTPEAAMKAAHPG